MSCLAFPRRTFLPDVFSSFLTVLCQVQMATVNSTSLVFCLVMGSLVSFLNIFFSLLNCFFVCPKSFCFQDKVSLYNCSGCFGTLSVDQNWPRTHRDPPASASSAGIKGVCNDCWVSLHS